MDKKETAAKSRKQKSGQRRNVTIKDLASELNLSITTISRALNGYPDVGEETRKRIRKTADRLGYRPNRNAQRLVTSRTRNIGWIRSDNEGSFVDPHFVEVFAGVLRGARARGYDIVVSADPETEHVDSLARLVAEGVVDGFILDLPRPNDPRIDYLKSAGVPFVVHGRDNSEPDYAWVDIDNRGIFRTLVKLLVAAGHERITFFNGDDHYCFASERSAGVFEALRDLGLPSDTVTQITTRHPMTHSGAALTEHMIERGLRAFIYSSALMAVEGISMLTRSGLAVGRDVAVVSMDDELIHLDLEPYRQMASFVHSSLREAGHALVEQVLEQCDTGLAGEGVLIGTEFSLHDGLDISLVPPEWHPKS